MWIFTTQGFYSVVIHREDPERLIIRARAREDIDALREQIPSLEPFEDRSADYLHRAIVQREEWVAALALLGSQIDYDNFKTAVADREGCGRARLYGHVWGEMLSLQED
jgi:hypothetical protein